jgi:hypothetical protein
MSTTATTTELQAVLNDYKIHLTGYDSNSATQGQEQEQSPSQVQNPPNWPTDYYRVPDYRPVNRNLDFAERPQGANGFEFAFLTMMFTGVCLNAVSEF